MGIGVKYRPHLPNRYGKHETPASLRIDLHYAHLGVTVRWDWHRYLKLAAFLNYTPYELASVICLTHKAVDSAFKRNRFPGPATLLLTLLEARAMREFSADIIANPFPNDPPQGP